MTLTSEPEGARVRYRPSDLEDTIWTEVGSTPVERVRLPNEELLIRFDLDGHHDYTLGFVPAVGSIHADLVSMDSPDSMVLVPDGAVALTGESVPTPAFWLDEFEVTNGQYQRFVDSGGYDDASHWAHAFADAGGGADLSRIGTEFVDRTGRPAPAGWELSRHPADRAHHPVQGVSWFEAVAYCTSVGKTLPTYFH